MAQDYLAGETLHSLARRHDLSRNLIRIWIQKFEAGAFDDEAASDTIEAWNDILRVSRLRPDRRAALTWIQFARIRSAPRRSASATRLPTRAAAAQYVIGPRAPIPSTRSPPSTAPEAMAN